MAAERITDPGYDQEDSYFHQKDLELLAKKRAERWPSIMDFRDALSSLATARYA